MNALNSTFTIAVALLIVGAGRISYGQVEMVPHGYVLQWSDNFSGNVLDTTKWNYRTDAKELTVERPQNVSLDGKGHLNIDLRQEEYAGKHFTGGGVVSKATFRYGYYEVRAKTTRYPGWHTAFWLFAGDGSKVPPNFPAVSNASTEIDDFEIDDPNAISMGIHEWLHGQHIEGTRCDGHFVPGFDASAAYHTYGVEWTEESITYYLDGNTVCKQAYPASQAPHDRLNIWLTSIAYKSGVAVGDQPSPASFGRVSYYIRDYYIRNTESGYAEYGPGWTDGMLQGYSRLGTRVSCSTGATAVWTPTVIQQGQYDISIYRTSNQRYDPASNITIHSHDGTATKTVNFKTGDEGWIDLGTFALDAGASNSVTESSSGHGCLYADTVKFMRR